jgi:AraC-like DNA-binding protein
VRGIDGATLGSRTSCRVDFRELGPHVAIRVDVTWLIARRKVPWFLENGRTMPGAKPKPFPVDEGNRSRARGAAGPGTGERSFAYYRRLDRLRQFVLEHLDEPIDLADAARVASLERTYFCRFFRRVVGVGFPQWLNETRVRRAEELLREHNLAITEVALAVGFRDLRTFERVFKRVAGTTPRLYKLAVRPPHST